MALERSGLHRPDRRGPRHRLSTGAPAAVGPTHLFGGIAHDRTETAASGTYRPAGTENERPLAAPSASDVHAAMSLDRTSETRAPDAADRRVACQLPRQPEERVVKRTLSALGAVVLAVSACESGGQPPRPASEPPPVAPPDVPAALTDQPPPTGVVLPPEFDLAEAQGLRTVHAGTGTDGAPRDSWELLGDRLATLWRDDSGTEYVTLVDLDGTPLWHTELPQLPEPAGDRPVQPNLQRLRPAEGGDWLVVTGIGNPQPAGPAVTRVLNIDADTGSIGLDVTLPTDRVAVGTNAGHLSATMWNEDYTSYHTLLLDPATGEQQRFDNPEIRTADILLLDRVTGFYDGEPIHLRACQRFLAADPIVCPSAVVYDGQTYESEADFLPLPPQLLDTEAGRRLLAATPDGRPVDLPCPIGTTRGIPESPSGRHVVVGSNLIDLQGGTTLCGDPTLWWTAVDDDGRGWGRLNGTTTLRVTYDVASRSVTTAEVPGTTTPLAITEDRQGLFGGTGQGTDVLLLAPQP